MKRSTWLGFGLAALAASIVFNRRSAARAERDHPPSGRFVTVGGTMLHYLDRGAGPVVVLLHGNGAMVQDWQASGMIDRLAVSHRVIAFDRPGYGYSERPSGRACGAAQQAELFAEAARQLGLHRPTVVGHSWGSLPALAWALNRPEEVGALVLASGYYFPQPRLDASALAPAALPGVATLLANSWLPIQARLTAKLVEKLIFSPDAVAERFRQGFPLDMAVRPGQLRASLWEGADMLSEARSLEPRYPDLAVPTTLIWGEGDRLVDPLHHSVPMASAFATDRLALPGVGHMVHYSATARVAAAIARAASHALTGRTPIPA